MTGVLVASAVLALSSGGVASAYTYKKTKKTVVVEEEYPSFDAALEAIKLYIVELVKEESILTVKSEEELRRDKVRKAQLKNALKMAPNGVREAKLTVKSLIRTWVMENLTMEKVRQFLEIDGEGEPSYSTMFEIILMKYQQEYNKKAFTVWMDKFGFADPKPAVGIARRGANAYYVTKAEFERAFYSEGFELSDEEAVEILVTKFYEKYMGWGPIDTLAEMDINGFNLGVSGALMDNTRQDNEKNPESVSEPVNSFWVYYKSNYIHLQFVDFEHVSEISRVIQLLIRWGNPGPLTKKSGYKVNTMHDQSRILAIRPDAGECWGAFVRKFSLDIKNPEELIIKKGYVDAGICAKMIEFLMMAQLTIAVTGRQGSGKTTLMKGIIGYYPPEWNLRVLEMAPEMYLKETYPNREIYSVQETAYVSMEELQDAFKKSDAMVTIIGEVATDPVSARMIQLAMTGSLCTLFSHHANTGKDLVLTLRNSLVNAGGFSNMQTAEKQVTDVLKINIHLGFENGIRFVKRITEIYQFEEGVPYPEFNPDDPMRSSYELQKEYFYRQTDRIAFACHDILYFDVDTMTYKVGEHFSDYLYNRIHSSLPANERKEFERFYAYYWNNVSMDGYDGVHYDTEHAPEIEIDRMVYDRNDAKEFLDNFVAEDFRFE
jgi:pilus assembly protein CpaF